MKQVTRYKANDGMEFENQESAETRDKLMIACEAALTILQDTPDELNWEGYVQQEDSIILKVKEILYGIANKEGVLKWWIDSQKTDHGKTEAEIMRCHPSWFCRMLDGSSRPLDIAYNRLCCIDAQGREWNQPYYANNPEKGELTRRN